MISTTTPPERRTFRLPTGARTLSHPPQPGIVISVDAMGGDGGPGAIIGGMEIVATSRADVRFVLHGDAATLEPLIARRPGLQGRVDLRHVSRAISMDEKPSHALRRGEGTSMWNTLATVEDGEATVAVSCGNTGALLALSMLRLRKAPGISRPAIAVLWPARKPQRFNVVLDAGADVRADADDLLKFAVMGAAYARHGLGVTNPRVGLLNVGTEAHKGRQELRTASDLLAAAAETGDFVYEGFVEGGDIASDRVDIVVTDGFTGNVALKTAEGTASLIRGLLKDAFEHSIFSRLGALFAVTSLRRLSTRIDPRRVNGGVFLGLNGTVVKSHGSADATGVAAALRLAYLLAESRLAEVLSHRLASDQPASESGAQTTKAEAG